ncbi:MAG: DUF1566 domain-containing protein, partial [Nitrospirae bacterium]|nr:DUF1566 domain-containing protein [Nitrospirota bacterium]
MWKNITPIALFAITLAACGLDGGGGTENTESAATFGSEGTPSSLVRLAVQGGPNPSPLTITLKNDGDCALSYTVLSIVTVDGQSWFSVSPAAGTLASLNSAALSVSIDVIHTALTPGTYTGTITITGSCETTGDPALGSPLTIPVNLTVTPIEIPDTLITSNPPNPSAVASASFTFISTVAGATFECSIDAGAFTACLSPKDYTALPDGSHTFDVRATDAAGNTDPTPASFTWVIDTTIANLTAIAVTPRDAAVAKGSVRSFTATGTYSDNTAQDITNLVTWSSSNTSVATVSAGGSVSGVAVGTTTITATLGGVSGQTTLTVSATALPRTGQVACYSETGANRECSGTGEDGERQAGVAWPVPRFVLLVDPASNGNCVADQLTGLEWVRVPDTTLWIWTGNPSVFTYAAAFDLCGANDWRLPNRRELRSLIHYGQINTAAWLNDPAQGFSNIQGGTTSIYWTSTTDANDSASAWSVYMGNGVTVGKDKGIIYYVWLVRTPAIPAPAAPARTGQTISYATEDDGALQAGVVWPDPRFT